MADPFGGIPVGGAVVHLRGDLSRLRADLKKARAETGEAVDQAERKLRARSSAFLGIGSLMAGGIIAAARSAIPAASALNEQVDATRVVFAETAEETLAWSKTTANAFGISQRAALQSAVGFQNMFRSTGLANGESAKMSRRLVELASDMASFNDQDPSEMLDRLRSGLAGEAEPLRRFGVFLSEATIRAKAMELGLVGANGELSEAAKVQARYAVILEKTAIQQGNFGATSGSVANQQRILAATTEQASAKLGGGFLSAMKALQAVGIGFLNVFGAIPEPVIKAAAAAGGLVAVTLLVKGAYDKARLAADTWGKIILKAASWLGIKTAATTADTVATTAQTAAAARAGVAIAAEGAAAGVAAAQVEALAVAQTHAATSGHGLVGILGGLARNLGRVLAIGGAVAGVYAIGSVASERVKLTTKEQTEAFRENAEQIRRDVLPAYEAGKLKAEEFSVLLQRMAKEGDANSIALIKQAIAARDGAEAAERIAGPAERTVHALNDTGAAAKKAGDDVQTSLIPALTKGADSLRVFAGQTRAEFRDWQKGTIESLNSVAGSLDELTRRSKVNSRQILKTYEERLRAQRDHDRSWERLLARGLPEKFAAELQKRGLEAAGVVKALANANEREFARIISAWVQGQRTAERTSERIGAVGSEISALDSTQLRNLNAELREMDVRGDVRTLITTLVREQGMPLDDLNRILRGLEVKDELRTRIIAAVQANVRATITGISISRTATGRLRAVMEGSYQHGGFISALGRGHGDLVPIGAHVGEYVINERATSSIGLAFLDELNRRGAAALLRTGSRAGAPVGVSSPGSATTVMQTNYFSISPQISFPGVTTNDPRRLARDVVDEVDRLIGERAADAAKVK